MGIPVLYQGSLYAPVPFVPIPPEPSGDPIGDALRADVALSVEYSGGQWIDPTGAHVWTNVSGSTKTSSAYGDMVTMDGVTQYIQTPSDSPDLSPGNHDFTLVAAVVVSAFLDNPNNAMFIAIKDNENGDDEYMLTITATVGGHLFYFQINDQNQNPAVAATTYGAAQLNTLTLVFAWYDSVEQSINIQINNGVVETFVCPVSQGVITPPTTLDIGGDSFGASTSPFSFFNGQILLHVLDRKLTQAEKDYLYNSGAGRALFP